MRKNNPGKDTMTLEYTGDSPCRIHGIGSVSPGEKKELPIQIAESLLHDPNWKEIKEKGEKENG
jgi:hypothetical protein